LVIDPPGTSGDVIYFAVQRLISPHVSDKEVGGIIDKDKTISGIHHLEFGNITTLVI